MALVCLAMVLSAAGLLMFALEGGVCLVMAFPITIPIALLGGIVGGNIVESRQTWKGGIAMLLAIVPAGSAIDRGFDRPVERVILTSVEIDAPPARVWHHVVAFDEITAPPEWYFRLGLAYPLRARIEGTGPGAIRRRVRSFRCLHHRPGLLPPRPASFGSRALTTGPLPPHLLGSR